MEGMDKLAINRFKFFNIICCIFRIVNFGYGLIFLSWIIVPFYGIHLYGQTRMYNQPQISKLDKNLVYLSTILFILISLFQIEEMEHGSYYLYESIIGRQNPRPDFSSPKSLIGLGIMSLIDAIINIRFLVNKKYKIRRLQPQP